jgi:hypothetical protein
VAVACFDGGWGWCSFSEEVAWLGCRSSSVAGLRRPRNRKWRRWEGRLHVQLEVDNGADWSSKRLEPAAASDRCWREEATWSSTEWRSGLLRTTDGGRDKVAGGN